MKMTVNDKCPKCMEPVETNKHNYVILDSNTLPELIRPHKTKIVFFHENCYMQWREMNSSDKDYLDLLTKDEK